MMDGTMSKSDLRREACLRLAAAGKLATPEEIQSEMAKLRGEAISREPAVADSAQGE